MKEEKENITLHPPSPSRVKGLKKINQGTPPPFQESINKIKQFSWPFSTVKSNL
jgi:hypothetical protein